LDFGYRCRSRFIFRDALIHAAGRYNTPEMQEEIKTMKKPVAEILIKKGKMLQEAMKTATLKMLSYYPNHMQREKTVGRADKDDIGRASYANDIMSWIGLVVMRHWLTQAIAHDDTHHAVDMGKEFIDYVLAGGDKYLSKAELEPFHAYFPMSSKGEAVLENRVADMKAYIKRFAVDFTHNESQLDVRRYPTGYFTCTMVDVRDYPWEPNYMGAPAETEEITDDEASPDSD